MRYACAMCGLSDAELNCVRTKIRRMSACRQLLTGMSISRYLPPIGTAGFERCCVSGNSRVPRPPPRTMARTSLITGRLFYGGQLVFVPNILAVHHVDHFLADVRRMVRDTLDRACDENQVHAPSDAVGVVGLVLEQIGEGLAVEVVDLVVAFQDELRFVEILLVERGERVAHHAACDVRHLREVADRARGRERRQGLDVFAVVDGRVADSFELGVDPRHHEEETQVLRNRRVDGDQTDRFAVDLELKAVERRFIREDPLHRAGVALDQRCSRQGYHLFRGLAHFHHPPLQALQLVLEFLHSFFPRSRRSGSRIMRGDCYPYRPSTYISVSLRAGFRKRSAVGACSMSSPSSMKMHSSLVRRAWAMLCVTIRMVYLPRRSSIRRSMAAVPRASRAEHGSSMRITCGFNGNRRAMHSFCCCSSVSRVARSRSRSFTASHNSTSRSDDSTSSSSRFRLRSRDAEFMVMPKVTFS